MKLILFGFLFGLFSALYFSYLTYSAIFFTIKKFFIMLFSIRYLFKIFKKKNNKKIAKVGDCIQWTMPDNCGRLSNKVYESEVVMVDLKEQHYGVYAEYGQDLIPFESAVNIDVIHRKFCG